MTSTVTDARTPTASDAGRAQLKPLTGLRFLAALLVVLHHYARLFPTSFLGHTHGLVHACLESGFIGVPFFFVLSGFILAYNYLTADGRMRVGCRDFWVARFARIYPVYVLGFVIAAGPFFWSLRGHTSPLVSGLTVLTLTQAWLPHVTPDAWNNPGWSLSDEAFFYLLFPLSVVAIAGLSRRQLYAAIGALWIASLAIACAYVAVHPDGMTWTWTARWYQFVLFNPLVRLPEFLMGVGLGRLFAIEAPGTGLRRAARARNLSGALLGGLTLVVAVSALRGQRQLLYVAAHNGLLALPFGLAIYYLAYTKSRLAAALSVPAVYVLGEASYAMYILHYPMGQWMVHYLTGVLGSSIRNGPIMFACYLAVVIGCSILSLHLLERPARRAIVRAFRGRSRRIPASVDREPAPAAPSAM